MHSFFKQKEKAILSASLKSGSFFSNKLKVIDGPFRLLQLSARKNKPVIKRLTNSTTDATCRHTDTTQEDRRVLRFNR